MAIQVMLNSWFSLVPSGMYKKLGTKVCEIMMIIIQDGDGDRHTVVTTVLLMMMTTTWMRRNMWRQTLTAEVVLDPFTCWQDEALVDLSLVEARVNNTCH